MTVLINPGSGPVGDATVENATVAMEVFARDVAERHGDLKVRWRRRPAADYNAVDGDGRFAFAMKGERVPLTIVQMPGLPLDRVRYVGSEGQNPIDFTRLYVDASSWLWLYAVDMCGPGEDEEEQREWSDLYRQADGVRRVYDFSVAPATSPDGEPDEPWDAPPLVLAEWRDVVGTPGMSWCRSCLLTVRSLIGWVHDPDVGTFWRPFWIVTDAAAAWAVCGDCAAPPARATRRPGRPGRDVTGRS